MNVIMTERSDPEALYALIRLVRPLYKVLEAAVALELAPTGIGVSQRAVLERLLDGGPMTVPAIGRGLILPRQFIQKLANELIAAGLVEKRGNAAHKRSPLLCLTAEGAALIRAVRARETEVMAPVARDLAAEEVATARAVMAAVIRDFTAHNAARAAERAAHAAEREGIQL